MIWTCRSGKGQGLFIPATKANIAQTCDTGKGLLEAQKKCNSAVMGRGGLRAVSCSVSLRHRSWQIRGEAGYSCGNYARRATGRAGG
ncbi:hypothetical protein KPB2_5514 [Klebsiella pneumoniae Kb677]|nr:hypothetical protein KPB2_5514 [Klebsiella pneumoniae Kb677]